MKYSEIIEPLKKFRQVIVTGPHRSGTTIAAKIIANDCHLVYLPEESFHRRNVFEFFELVINKSRDDEPVVIQAPSMSAFVHHIPGVAVVFMRRNVNDIIKSERRILWTNHDRRKENDRYFRFGEITLYNHPTKAKYEVWDKYQKMFLTDRYFDLDYESLSEHKLWVGEKERQNFKPRQTEIENAD
jgi:MinD-like ATPase involved in chromosome partitioning or flagellar assembly